MHTSYTQQMYYDTHVYTLIDAEDLTKVILIAVFGGGGGLFAICIATFLWIAMCLVCYHCGVVRARQAAATDLLPTDDPDDDMLYEQTSHPQAETHSGEPPPSYDVAASYPLVNPEDLDRTETREDSTIQDSTIEDSTIEDSTVEDSTIEGSTTEDSTTEDSTIEDSTIVEIHTMV